MTRTICIIDTGGLLDRLAPLGVSGCAASNADSEAVARISEIYETLKNLRGSIQ